MRNADQAKITIVGDIMCEPLLLKAARKNGLDFTPVFAHVRKMFENSDYVIGNLETPLAGKEAGYVNNLFSFNTPDTFADAMKSAGMDFALTANNHCLDRGMEGLLRTLQVLDKVGLAHTGTYQDPENDTNAYFSVGDTRVAIVSYTYGTNYASNKLLLDDHQSRMINLLRPQEEFYFQPSKKKKTFAQRVAGKLLRVFPLEKRYYIRKYLGMTINTAHADDYLNKDSAAPYIEKMKKDIALAKSKADLVLFCPHIGGQFNKEPGAFSDYVFEEASKAGCDAILASHAHVVMKSSFVNGVPSFYSLGNFSMSPNSVYLVRDQKPEYGIAVHLYLENKVIQKVAFSILKMVEPANQMLTVYPADVMYQNSSGEERVKLRNDICEIYTRVTGRTAENLKIQSEFEL